ncbi:SDR family oxidoreductase [bacterium]|nr:SDR family oxidoreductase [bacterium]
MIEAAGAFAGQHIFITGATGGIGSIIAARLAREACKITAIGYNEQRLSDLKEYVESIGGQCAVIKADLSNQTEGDSFIEEAMDKFGKIDTAFLLAGSFTFYPVCELESRIINQDVTLNLISPIILASSLFKEMAPRGEGRITIVSSLAGIVPLPYLSVYNSAKSGLVMFCRSAAPEFSEKGISLTCIVPGAVDTHFISKYRPSFEAAGWHIDSAQNVAEEILRATALGKKLVFTGGFERIGAKISPLFPEFTERIMGYAKNKFNSIIANSE